MTSKESLVIYSPKTGEMLCKIFSPPDTDWASANDEKVIQWAWQQAYLIKYSWNALQIVAKDFANRTVGPKFKIYPGYIKTYCLRCNQPTMKIIKLSHPIYFWLRSSEFACDNHSCYYYHVHFPITLFHHSEEIPDKYLSGIKDYINKNQDKIGIVQIEQLKRMLHEQNYFPPA